MENTENMIQNIKIRSSAIDLVKFICAFLVIGIHTYYSTATQLDGIYFFTQILARIAVPFFFVAAGYFFTVKYESEVHKIKVFWNYIKKLSFLYIIWSAIYFVMDFDSIKASESTVPKIIALYFKNFFYNGSHFHLWFVPALLLGISFLYFALKWHVIRLFLSASFILYLFGLLGDSYYGLCSLSFKMNVLQPYFEKYVTTRNGLFFGTIFVLMGGFIALTKHKLNRNIDIVLALFFFLELSLESVVLTAYRIPLDRNMYLMLLPFTFYFFRSLLSIDFKMSKKWAILLSRYSMLIYFVHAIFLDWLGRFATHKSLYFILVSFASLGSAMVIEKVREILWNWGAKRKV